MQHFLLSYFASQQDSQQTASRFHYTLIYCYFIIIKSTFHFDSLANQMQDKCFFH